jgi:chaperone modulatory protein CbpM
MSQTHLSYIQGHVVEEEVHLTMVELCQACNAERQQLISWVYEGVLQPAGETPTHWRFSGDSLRRARLAQRLTRDLELNPPGVALVLDLLDQIDELKNKL